MQNGFYPTTQKQIEMKDIETPEDIKLLVDSFYDDVQLNPLLGNIFNEVMKTNWDKHLPKMYGFWENIVFQTGNYRGRPFLPHLEVNAKETLTANHFNTWLQLFHQTIDKHFSGPKAEELKFKSQNIKEIWNFKIDYINNYDTLSKEQK